MVCCFLLPAFGQQEALMRMKPAQLWALLSELPADDPYRAAVLNELAYQYRIAKKDSAKIYARQAIQLAAEERLEQSNSWVVLGLVAKYETCYDSAEVFFRRALELRQEEGAKEKAASCYNNLGLLYYNKKSNYQRAVEYFRAGIEMVSDSRMAGKLHNNLGDAYIQMGRYDEAVKALGSSKAIRVALEDELGLAWTTLNLGLAHQKMESYPLSEINLEESLKTFKAEGISAGIAKCQLLMGNNDYHEERYAEAARHYEAALEYRQLLPAVDTVRLHGNLGSIYYQLGQYEAALEKFRLVVPQFEVLQQSRDQVENRYNFGNVFFALSEYEKARNQYKQGLAILERDSITDSRLRAEGFSALSRVNRQLEQFESALVYHYEYTQLQDSIYDRAQRAQMLENERLAMEDRLSRQRLRQQFVWGLVGFVVLWLLLAIAVLYAYNQQKKRRIADQEVNYLLQQQELEVAYARQHAQDQEQARIAQDLHDRLGSMLTTIKVYFGELDSRISQLQQEAQSRYQKANELLDEAFDSVRQIAHDLKSGVLAKFGLEAALESFVDTIKDSANRLEVELVTNGLEERLDGKMEFEVYKIVQELVSNVLKHADASKLSIQANRFEEEFNVMVEDNGEGFNLEQARQKEGLGIRGTEARVAQLGGSMQVDSVKGRGTTVSIDIPLP
jgi:two-component system, NarL family, sensor kinase